MERIKHALKNRVNLKALNRKLGTGENKIYALGEQEGNAAINMDKIAKVAEEFYRDLYSSRDKQADNGRGSSPV